MPADSHRYALGVGLPWAYLGLVVLAAAIAVPAILSAGALDGIAAQLHVARIAPVVEWLGAAAFFVGALALARARVAGHASPWFVALIAAWSGVLVLGAFDVFAPRAALDAGRVVLAALAMYAFARGMPWLLSRRQPRAVRARWTLARRAFGAQLLLLALLPAIGLVGGSPPSELMTVPGGNTPAGVSLFWLAFAGPYVILIPTLRWTIGRAPGRRSLEDILRG